VEEDYLERKMSDILGLIEKLIALANKKIP